MTGSEKDQVGTPTYGENLKRLRLERRWTQAQVAARIGYTPSAVTYLENGRNAIRFDVATRLARIFKCSRRLFHPGV